MKKSIAVLNEQRIQRQTEQGITLWGDISETLNGMIRSNGQIQINNETIWGEYLHKWNNEEWALVLAVLRDLMEAEPGLFKSFHENAVLEAETVLIKYWNEHARVLDKRAHKKKAWKLLMTMREVWNKARGLDIPNEDSSKITTKVKQDLFEIQ